MAPTRRNLALTPSLENTLASGGNSTQSLSTTTGVIAGTKSLAITPNSSLDDSYADLNTVGTRYPTLVNGQTYTISGYITLTAPQGGTPHPNRARRIVVFTRPGTGGYVEVYSSQAPNTAGTHRVSATFTVPSDNHPNDLSIRLYNGATSGNGTVYWDGLLFEQGSTLGTYFDGNSADSGDKTYTWAANGSSEEHVGAAGRTNLVTNPSFEVDLSGYLFDTARFTATRTTAESVFGSASVRLTRFTGTGVRPLAYGFPYDASSFTVPYDSPVTVSLYAKGSATANGSGVRLLIHLMNSSGVWFNDVIQNITIGSSWTRFSVTSSTLTAGTKVGFSIDCGGGDFYVDGVMMELGSTLGTYFDGSSSVSGKNYAWLGTANAAQSRESTGKTIASALSATGTLTSVFSNYQRIASPLSGSGTLTSVLSGYQHIASGLSGSATLSSTLHRHINSQLSGSATLTSVLGRYIVSGFNGSATLTSSLRRHIQSSLSGSATLTSAFTGLEHIVSPLSGSATLTSVLVTGKQIISRFGAHGALTSELEYSPRFTSHLGVEMFLHSELEYILAPQPLESLPLGKLVSYTVNNAAVPLNPAEGSGSTPSVNATYIKGRNAEFALGENFTVENGAVGTYSGEIVRLSLNKKSDKATISTDTLLTLTNVDMHLYPFIDAAPSLWTAARAIEYWTQQTGIFYDKVDGECAVYASGYGHPNGYAEGAGNSHFYDKLTAGTTSASVVNNRTVTSFGSAATAVMAQHEALQTRVPITVGANRKMVFSFGLGVRGTGRTATVSYKFLDGLNKSYSVTIEATSAGAVTAKVNDAQVSTLTVDAGGDYRVFFSLERMSDTALMVKLSAHSDDLAGGGELVANGQAKVVTTSIPGTLWLTSLVHSSAGGSGAEMLRWGTYLSVAKYHPTKLPRTQKTLEQSAKPLGFVSGFTANVWTMLNEFCSINRLDLSFAEDRLVMGPRTNGFNGSVKFSDFEVTSERREKYRQVAVVNKQSKAVTTNTAVLWRADSVFQVAAREVFETTVQTGHSILSVANPVAVTGIWPFPYTEGGGQYVVTGADGYIVSPEWWADNGGKIEVSLTEVDGEIAIKITAPTIDTVRAPYRISEGEGDRPALYISGAGIVNKPEELHINTGAKKAREGFDQVFESPFIATVNDAFNTAARMAQAYSAAAAEVSFGTPNDFDTPSVLGIYPSGVVFTDNERNYKITDASQTHSEVTGSAVPFTTIAAYKASFPEGATIRDEKARHFGRTIKQANIKPLRSNDESA